MSRGSSGSFRQCLLLADKRLSPLRQEDSFGQLGCYKRQPLTSVGRSRLEG